jgi:hypothetical protein
MMCSPFHLQILYPIGYLTVYGLTECIINKSINQSQNHLGMQSLVWVGMVCFKATQFGGHVQHGPFGTSYTTFSLRYDNVSERRTLG